MRGPTSPPCADREMGPRVGARGSRWSGLVGATPSLRLHQLCVLMHRTAIGFRVYQRSVPQDAAWASRRLVADSPQNGELSARPCVGDYWPGTKGEAVRASVECTCFQQGHPGFLASLSVPEPLRERPPADPAPTRRWSTKQSSFDCLVNHRSPPARHRLAGEGMGAFYEGGECGDGFRQVSRKAMKRLTIPPPSFPACARMTAVGWRPMRAMAAGRLDDSGDGETNAGRALDRKCFPRGTRFLANFAIP
jgi:hypothetical protein